MLICNVVGARPNFMKVAPVVTELKRRGIPQMLVHTGQHYDKAMSDVFFDELGMPKPDVYLGVGSDSHGKQTARILEAMEEVCVSHRPSLLLVAGDVNSTVAGALAAAKLGIPVGHIEAGLRSFDRSMPEEINRVLTDHLSDFLFTTEQSGNDNLRKEGIAETKVFFVGNCMVDSLRHHEPEALRRRPWAQFGLEEYSYALLTLHRPSNVDDPAKLEALLGAIGRVASELPVLFPIHPRTRARLDEFSFQPPPTLRLCEPLPYLTFLGLMARAKMVLTDSGGIQEETTSLNVPCFTLRENTERPVTLQMGTNWLIGGDMDKLSEIVGQVCRGVVKPGSQPPLWDGKAAVRIVDVIERQSRPD